MKNLSLATLILIFLSVFVYNRQRFSFDRAPAAPTQAMADRLSDSNAGFGANRLTICSGLAGDQVSQFAQLATPKGVRKTGRSKKLKGVTGLCLHMAVKSEKVSAVASILESAASNFEIAGFFESLGCFKELIGQANWNPLRLKRFYDSLNFSAPLNAAEAYYKKNFINNFLAKDGCLDSPHGLALTDFQTRHIDKANREKALSEQMRLYESIWEKRKDLNQMFHQDFSRSPATSAKFDRDRAKAFTDFYKKYYTRIILWRQDAELKLEELQAKKKN